MSVKELLIRTVVFMIGRLPTSRASRKQSGAMRLSTRDTWLYIIALLYLALVILEATSQAPSITGSSPGVSGQHGSWEQAVSRTERP